MSFRPRTEAKGPSAANVAAPGLNRLSHVLSVGLSNTSDPVNPAYAVGAAATLNVDATISRTEFEFEVMRIVDIDAKMLTKADYNRYKMKARELLSKTSAGGAGGLSKAGKEAGRLAGGAAVLTRKSAARLAEEIKRRWQRATPAIHWSSSTPMQLGTLLKKNYKLSFPERAWKNIIRGNNVDKWLYSESGGNCHAEINIDDIDDDVSGQRGMLRVKVFISFNENPKDEAEKKMAAIADKLVGISALDLGNSNQMASITHKAIMERIDSSIDDAVLQLKAEWDAALSKAM